jgi:hypothetical protein
MGRDRRIVWLLRAGLVVAVLAGLALLSAWLRTERPLGPQPRIPGVVRENAEAWGRIVVAESGCVLINNFWNARATRGRLQQRVFVAERGGKSVVGWAWRSPWQLVPAVVSYPEIACGDKPWDEPLGLSQAFPFAVGSRRLSVDYDARIAATGTHNLTFTLWVVSALPAARGVVSHEIMVWIANEGQRPAGTPRGKIALGSAEFDVFIEQRQRDNSGANANRWTYVAVVAQRPVLRGPLDLSPLLEFLLHEGVLSRRNFVTSLELGSEVSEGAGSVELTGFSVTVR